jgi:hypothetical protein
MYIATPKMKRNKVVKKNPSSYLTVDLWIIVPLRPGQSPVPVCLVVLYPCSKGIVSAIKFMSYD